MTTSEPARVNAAIGSRAGIVSRHERSERRPSERLLAELAEVSDLAARLAVPSSSSDDFDVGLTTDDMLR
jgi:hypothetical protein